MKSDLDKFFSEISNLKWDYIYQTHLMVKNNIKKNIRVNSIFIMYWAHEDFSL